MTAHPRQADLDRLVRAAVKARLDRWQVALREVDGKIEPVLIYDHTSEDPEGEVKLGCTPGRRAK